MNNKELIESLNKGLSDIKESTVVEEAIRKARLSTEELKLAKVIQTCCSGNDFTPSNQLINALVELAIEYAEGYDDEAEGNYSNAEEAIVQALKDICLSDEWAENVLGDSVGLGGVAKFLKNAPVESFKWLRAVKYCQEQDQKVFKMAVAKVKSSPKYRNIRF